MVVLAHVAVSRWVAKRVAWKLAEELTDTETFGADDVVRIAVNRLMPPEDPPPPRPRTVSQRLAVRLFRDHEGALRRAVREVVNV